MSADTKVITDDRSGKAARTRRAERVAQRHNADRPTGDQLFTWHAIRQACRDADDMLVDGAQYKGVRTTSGYEIRYHRYEPADGAQFCEQTVDEWVANVHLVRGGIVQMPAGKADGHQPLVYSLEEAGIDVAID